VLEADEGRYLIAAPQAVYQATLAASCLVEPKVDDLILGCLDQDDCFILAVLKRADSQTQAVMNFPQNTQIKASAITLNVGDLKTRSVKTELSSQEFSVKGENLSLSFRLITMAASLVTSVFRSFFNRSRNLTLKVDSNAAIAANRLTACAEQDMAFRAGGIDIQAKDSVKIDGRSLRLG
jgi:hypothetical protein